MDKTAPIELHRLFLIERLPEPLTPASSHIQIFDNYLENTRLRVRRIRDPYSNAWTRMLQQRFTTGEGDATVTRQIEIHLNEVEYALFERFPTREIRKNRYFHEFDGISFVFDVYLGALWGLHTAKIEFPERETMENFNPPPCAVLEVTENAFFSGAHLVEKNFSDVQTEAARVAGQNHLRLRDG